MGSNGSTGSLSETSNDVDDSWWETSFLDELTAVQTCEWGLFCNLDDYDVTGSNGWTNLPCPHEEWEVPWNDLTTDTDLGKIISKR